MDNIAVLISTCNRNEFLSCIFNYYSKNNFRHKIYVGDASDYDIHILMVNKIKSKYKNLDIQFVHFPDYNNGLVDNLKVIEQLCELVTEKFITLTGDDDFLIPETIEKCINYLCNNDSYAGIYGNGKFICYDNYSQQSLITGNYQLKGYENNTGLERLKEISKNYSVLSFGIFKTSCFKKACRNIKIIDDTNLNELSLVFSLAIQGKTKNINDDYLVRGLHNKKEKVEKQIYRILNKKWYNSYGIFNEQLANLLAENDGITLSSASEYVDGIFTNYIIDTIVNDSKKGLNTDPVYRILITQLKLSLKLSLIGKYLIKIKDMCGGYKETRNSEYVKMINEWDQLYESLK